MGLRCPIFFFFFTETTFLLGNAQLKPRQKYNRNPFFQFYTDIEYFTQHILNVWLFARIKYEKRKKSALKWKYNLSFVETQLQDEIYIECGRHLIRVSSFC